MRERPVFFYDAQCEFCCLWVARWKKLTGESVEYQPLREPALSSELRETDGTIYDGAQSVIHLLSYAPGKKWILWTSQHIPGARFCAEFFYKRVSSCRPCALKFTRWFFSFSRKKA